MASMSNPPALPTGDRFEAFVALIARLRAPDGCPWDREQTHHSLKPMTLEEAYEVVEAIDHGTDEDLAGELGDLLLQVVFHAQMAREAGRFDIDAVLGHVHDKMVRRHPHVFGAERAGSSDEVLRNWEALKQAERRARAGGDEHAAPAESLLDGAKRGLPAMLEAFQLGTRVARVGFDWPDATGVLAKLREELAELEDALRQRPDDLSRVQEELGDLLFTAVSLGRLAGCDAESALKAANTKFRRRFQAVEARLHAQGRGPADAAPGELDAIWEAVKRTEQPPD
jgi:MazG family protein